MAALPRLDQLLHLRWIFESKVLGADGASERLHRVGDREPNCSGSVGEISQSLTNLRDQFDCHSLEFGFALSGVILTFNFT